MLGQYDELLREFWRSGDHYGVLRTLDGMRKMLGVAARAYRGGPHGDPKGAELLHVLERGFGRDSPEFTKVISLLVASGGQGPGGHELN